LTLADDADSDPSNGFQIEVRANTSGIGEGEVLELRVDGAPEGTAEVMDQQVVFSDVTLSGDQHELVVCSGEDCGVQSNVVRVTVQAACPSIDFLAPAPPSMGDTLVLGGPDDTDGEECGSGFTTTFQVATTAPAGTTVRLEVEGTEVGRATASGSVVTFEDVSLPNRGDDANRVEAFVEAEPGVECAQQYPVPVLVDCAGPSCAFTEPDLYQGRYLNQTHDEDMADNLQTTVRVATGVDAVGEEVELWVDGSLRDTAQVMSVDSDGVATFSLELTQGSHTVRPVCRDAAGNVNQPDGMEWVVDLEPCDVVIEEIAGLDASLEPVDRILTPDDDEEPGEAGVQVSVGGGFGGSLGCREVRAAAASSCDAIDGASFVQVGSDEDPDPSSYELPVTVSSGASQKVCVQTRDEAGNVGPVPPEEITTFFESDAPNVSIQTPESGDRVNASGGTFTDGSGEERDYLVDLDTDSIACNVEFEVQCEDDRGTVALYREGQSTPLAGGEAIDCPESGTAVFPDVRLPRLGGAQEFNVVAEHVVGDRLTPGRSSPISLRADCEAPSPEDRVPECGDVLHPEDDADPETSELEFDVDIARRADDVDAIRLRVVDQSSSNVVFDGTEPVGGNNLASFSAVPFGSAGVYELLACATDDLDNEGCLEDCMVTVGDVPVVTVTTPDPDPGQVYDMDDDCDGADGLQLQVVASTDAPDGAMATVRIGESGSPSTTTETTTVSGGVVDVCMDSPEGEGLPVSVAVEDPDSGLVGTGQVEIDVDSMPPTEAIDDLEVLSADLPRHTRRFQWTAVPDGDGSALERYLLRCADAPIDDEGAWDAARPLDFDPEVSPATAGTVQSGDVVGFRPDTTVHCVLRAEDLAGALTPLDGSVEVEVPPLNGLVVETDSGLELGRDVQGVGDVNGDGVDDVLIAGDGEAYLYFGFGEGSAPAGPVEPDVVLQGSSSDWFGRNIAALGDFSGDGRPDFAVAAEIQNDLRGAVYVFYGRSSTNPWPSTIDVAGPGCAADVCLLNDDGVADAGPDEGAFFGGTLAGIGDFNGDGFGDLAIGARNANDREGLVYIVLGGQFGPNAEAVIPQDEASVNGFIVAPPADTDARFGWRVAGLGRAVGADMLSDVGITASGLGPPSFDPERQGALYVLRGRSTSPGGLVTLDGDTELAVQNLVEVQRSGPVGNYGTELSNVGDLDGDGFVEIGLRSFGVEEVRAFLGALGGYDEGRTFVVHNDSAEPAGDQLGRHIAQAAVPGLVDYGDVDGDGRSDLFVGSRQNPDFPGVGQLFYGQPDLPATRNRSTADLTLDPATDGGTYRSVGYVGDIDGDGAWDLAVGDPDHDSDAGQVVLYY
ncbi:MAG: FG-GAP-like repeat-containing protein, partial [Myxococcota bacterium]